MSVPERIVANEHFASYLETSDEWIRERTGILERRWAEPDVSASALAEPAARQAVERAGLQLEDIDGVIVATVTPDYVFPSTATFLQHRLGLRPGVAFDVNAVCSGFIYALTVADGLIRSSVAQNILVVGVDIYSRIINPHDRSTCVLFGDGAGAVVLSALAPGRKAAADKVVSGSAADLQGIYASDIGADGAHTQILCVPLGTAAMPTPDSLLTDAHYLKMEGREVFKLAVRKLAEVHTQLFERTGIPADAVDYFISHQANKRILLSMAKYLGVSEDRVPMNLDKYGNTSAATIPILLAEMEADGRLSRGKLLALSAFGGGVTWGVTLLRW